jgi:hypothetical protein
MGKFERRIITAASLAASINAAQAQDLEQTGPIVHKEIAEENKLECERLPKWLKVLDNEPPNEQIKKLTKVYNVDLYGLDKNGEQITFGGFKSWWDINSDFVSCTGSKPIELDLTSFSLHFYRDVTVPLDFENQDVHELSDISSGLRVTATMVEKYPTADGSNLIARETYVFQPDLYRSCLDDEPYAWLDLDLPEAGIRLDGYIRYKTEVPFYRSEDGYLFYNSGLHIGESRQERDLALVSQEIHKVESRFTGNTGSIVRGVDIIKGHNAFAPSYVPDVIGIGRGVFRKENATTIASAARHETWHTILIFYLKGLDAQEAAVEFHDTLKDRGSDLSRLIDESEWYDDIPEYMGHPDDPVFAYVFSEFYVSLMNSLDHPDWEQKVKRVRMENPEAFNDYYNAIVFMRDQFVKAAHDQVNPDFTEDAEIFSFLGSRIAFLESIK